MTRKKKLWLVVGGLAVAAVVGLYLSLPRLLYNVLVYQAEKSGLQNLRLRVISVGLGSLELADVSAGDVAAPSLRIRSVVVNYTPLGLLRKQFRAIRLDGVVIRLEERGQGVRFPGWSGTGGGGALPALARLDLTNGRLLLLTGGRELDIPFALHGSAVDLGYVLHAGLHPPGLAIRLLARFDSQFSSGSIEFSAPVAELGSLAELAGQTIAAGGRVALYGKIALRDGRFDRADIKADGSGIMTLNIPDQGEFELDSLRLSLEIDSAFVPRDIVARARGRRLRFGDLAVDSPFELNLSSPRWPDFEFSILGMRLDQPLPLLAEQISGKVAGPWEMVKISGDFQAQDRAGLPGALGAGSWSMGKPYALSGDFQAVRKGQEWDWSLKTRGDSSMSLVSGKNSVRGILKLDASLQGDTRQARATVSGRLANADLRLANGRAKSGELSGNAGLTFAFGGDWGGRGTVQVRDGQFLAAGNEGVQATGINLRLPWRYPVKRDSDPGAGSGNSGSFSIARLQSNGMRGKDILGLLTQDGRGITFSGLAHTDLSGIEISFKGSFAPLAAEGKLSADFLVPSTVLPAKTPLQQLHPLLQGTEASGRFGIQGRIWAANGKIGGSAGLEIVDGDFAHAGLTGIVVHGFQTSVQLDNLFDLITQPSQRLLFKDLRWQGNTFLDGEVAFTGEGGGKLFIESGRFLWNRGTITLDPLRFDPGGAWPQVTLRCRDVDLAEMLNTLAGSKIVSSDARLSGVIPLKFVNGSPVFIDGYLDSAPGIGGRLRVSKPETISGGQVLVEEAIRDFHYNWIKVRLGSREDRLNMVISIDGAPARKLPLRYDQNRKDFVRDPTGKPSVELKGLLLDIRFDDIDLKDLLETGGKMTAGKK